MRRHIGKTTSWFSHRQLAEIDIIDGGDTMAHIAEKTVADVMKERSSVRKYKKGIKIPPETLNRIIELAGTAPSSWNLQHWKFIVVEDEENKKSLYPVANNQQQVLDCSALIVVLGDKEADKNAEEVYASAVKAGYMSDDAKNKLVDQIHVAYRTVEHIGVHEAIRNASLAAMQLMLAAKAHGIDSCPMGGFQPDALCRQLHVPERYIPVMLITLGYAETPAHRTERFPLSKIVVREHF